MSLHQLSNVLHAPPMLMWLTHRLVFHVAHLLLYPDFGDDMNVFGIGTLRAPKGSLWKPESS